MLLYSFLFTLVLVLGAPYWLFRMATSGRYRAGFGARLGIFPKGFREHIAAIRVERRGSGGVRPLMWIHAVSVGEVLAAARLIEEFRTGEFHRINPGMVFALSTTTEAGKRLADKRFPGGAVFYFPLDFGFAVRRYLDLLSPEMVVLVESELWPQLITQCSKRAIPIVVANARISDRSFPRYMRLKALWRPLLQKIAFFLAQSSESAERLRQIGAPRVELTGNLKYDARSGKETVLVSAVRQHIEHDSPVVLCGSTLDGEETMILKAWETVLPAFPKAVLVVAPRQTDRFDQVAHLVKSARLPLVRASTYLCRQVAIQPGSVFLMDTIGDLATMYGAASVAFVGGSLANAGGHNPLEPAKFGVPVLMGRSFENFREIVEAMQAEDGIRIVTPATLGEAFIELLRDSEEAKAMGARAQAVSAAQSGAAARTSDVLLKLLPKRTNSEASARR